jgi:ABC-2 type transport system permease protein
MAEVEDLCSVLTIVHRGRAVFSGSAEQLRKQGSSAVHRLSTSDDPRAGTIAARQTDVQITRAVDGNGLDVCADEAALDRFVIELGREGVAIRSLDARDRSLSSLFLKLTETREQEAAGAGPQIEPAPSESVPEGPRRRALGPVSARGVAAATRVEWAKLTAQIKVWAVLAVCLAGPFAFVVAVKAQSSLPEDTLFGRWVRTSGFAVPLLVLGFAASWAFPVLTSVVSGDLFSAEDRYGTWPTLLTRSRTRGEIFTGKVLTALTFSLAAVSLLALSSVLAGVLVIGHQPLLGLSGTLLPPGRALALVAAAWASILPPVFGFTALAVLASVATRSSAAGIGLPVLIGFAMELCSYVNGPAVLRRALLTLPFLAWHGLLTTQPYYGPLLQGAAVSGVYLVGCLAAAYGLLGRRDMGS